MKTVFVLLATGFSVLALFFVTAVSSEKSAHPSALLSVRTKADENAKFEQAFADRIESGDTPAPPPASAPAEPTPEKALKEQNSFDGRPGGRFKVALAQEATMPHKEGGGEGWLEKDQDEARPATRAWFPETFLFEPLVVTDSAGRANVPVRVPDRLTTWRILALAHSRQGGQAGTTTSFLGTLPTYVDPIVPPSLFAGDQVVLPVQLVNTTDAEVTSTLKLESSATLVSSGGPVRVPALGNSVQHVTLTAAKPGELVFKATLGSTDAVLRTLPVLPAGQREVVTHGGTLASPRSFELTGPAAALVDSERVVLRVFPGALGLIRSELSAAPGRGGVAEDAYLLHLLGIAPVLLKNLGEEPNTQLIRDLSVVATQRVMRHARAPTVDTATLLTEAALTHPDNPVLSRLGERLAGQVAQAQRPDGTCQGANGWTLQRLLVTTGECVRATQAARGSPRGQQRFTATSLKAAGAFERNVGRINDPYTAAAALVSGAVRGTVAQKLKQLVLEGVVTKAEGAVLEVPVGVVRADGSTPSTIEATAMAVLALENEPKAPLADLGTSLLGAYTPETGWGDGRTNLLAIRAVTTLFKERVPSNVRISLARDGRVLTTGQLTPETLKSVLVLEADARGASGVHTWSVTAEPPVPGLGYVLGLAAYVPWKESAEAGLELTMNTPTELTVGRASELSLRAAYPGGTPMKLRVGLPAGVQHDTPSLEALVTAQRVTRYETEDGAVTLHLPPLSNGSVWEGAFKLIPTLAGRLQAQPTTLAVEHHAERAKTFAPKVWVIR